jgi:hypothetical protein
MVYPEWLLQWTNPVPTLGVPGEEDPFPVVLVVILGQNWLDVCRQWRGLYRDESCGPRVIACQELRDTRVPWCRDSCCPNHSLIERYLHDAREVHSGASAPRFSGYKSPLVLWILSSYPDCFGSESLVHHRRCIFPWNRLCRVA